jgi:DNA-binding transcriptional LysR family regulator
MDRSEEWRMFVAVASQRSFATAARQLGKSPQAVTRAIAALEARLGTRLLNRTTRSVSLSDDGGRVLERARNALAELDALEAPPDTDGALRGTLAVTAPALFGQLHVLPIVDELLRAHGDVTVRLLLLDRVVALADEGIDVAVRIGALPDSALVASQVGHVRTVLVASPGYLADRGTPRSVDALVSHACIAFSTTTPIPDRWAFPGGRRVRVRPRLVVNTAHAAIDAALAGAGIARVVSYQVGHLVETGKLRIVLPRSEPSPVPVHVVTLPGPRTRVTRVFTDALVVRLRDRLSDPRPIVRT